MLGPERGQLEQVREQHCRIFGCKAIIDKTCATPCYLLAFMTAGSALIMHLIGRDVASELFHKHSSDMIFPPNVVGEETANR